MDNYMIQELNDIMSMASFIKNERKLTWDDSILRQL